LTTAAAVCFMLTSLGLAYVSSHNRAGDVQLPTSQQLPVQVPAEGTAPESAPDASPEAAQVPDDSSAVPSSPGGEAGPQ
jgi:hypothetical protein